MISDDSLQCRSVEPSTLIPKAELSLNLENCATFKKNTFQ